MLSVPQEKLSRQLDLNLITGLKTKEDVSLRIEELVSFYSELNAAVSLMDLNRRFGKTAKRLGWAALSDIIKEGTEKGLFGFQLKRNKIYLYNAQFLEKYLLEAETEFTEAGLGFDRDSARSSYLEMLIQNAPD